MPQEENSQSVSPTSRYSLEDWQADWTWYLQERQRLLQGQLSLSDPKAWKTVVDYFDLKYRQHADHHRERLLASAKYVAQHSTELNERPFAVAGEAQIGVSKTLVYTLWLIYNQLEDRDVTIGPTVGDVKIMGREIQRRLDEASGKT